MKFDPSTYSLDQPTPYFPDPDEYLFSPEVEELIAQYERMRLRIHDMEAPPIYSFIEWNDEPDVIAWLKAGMVAAVQRQPDYLYRDEEDDGENGRSFKLIAADDLIRDAKPPQWVIKGYLEQANVGQVIGEPKVGKSFITVDMACCIATGTPWQGAAIKLKGPCIYVAGEGHAGISRRVLAWARHHTIDPSRRSETVLCTPLLSAPALASRHSRPRWSFHPLASQPFLQSTFPEIFPQTSDSPFSKMVDG
jgi:hypothetical protein